MSQAEISESSPLPVFVTNNKASTALPSIFTKDAELEARLIFNAGGLIYITVHQVEGEWICCDVKIGGVSNQEKVWLQVSALHNYVWQEKQRP